MQSWELRSHRVPTPCGQPRGRPDLAHEPLLLTGISGNNCVSAPSGRIVASGVPGQYDRNRERTSSYRGRRPYLPARPTPETWQQGWVRIFLQVPKIGYTAAAAQGGTTGSRRKLPVGDNVRVLPFAWITVWWFNVAPGRSGPVEGGLLLCVNVSVFFEVSNCQRASEAQDAAYGFVRLGIGGRARASRSGRAPVCRLAGKGISCRSGCPRRFPGQTAPGRLWHRTASSPDQDEQGGGASRSAAVVRTHPLQLRTGRFRGVRRVGRGMADLIFLRPA